MCDYRQCNENTPIQSCYVDYCASKCYPEREGSCSLNFPEVAFDVPEEEQSMEVSCKNFHQPDFELGCWEDDALYCEHKHCNSYTEFDQCSFEYCLSKCNNIITDGRCALHFPEVSNEVSCDAHFDDDWWMDCYSEEATQCHFRNCNDETTFEECYFERCSSLCFPDEAAICDIVFSGDEVVEADCQDFEDPSWELDCIHGAEAGICEVKQCNDDVPLEVCAVDYCVSKCYPDAPAQCSVMFPQEAEYHKVSCGVFWQGSWQFDCAYDGEVCLEKQCNVDTPLEECSLFHCTNKCYPEAEAQCSLGYAEEEGAYVEMEYECEAFYDEEWEYFVEEDEPVEPIDDGCELYSHYEYMCDSELSWDFEECSITEYDSSCEYYCSVTFKFWDDETVRSAHCYDFFQDWQTEEEAEEEEECYDYFLYDDPCPGLIDEDCLMTQYYNKCTMEHHCFVSYIGAMYER